MGIVKINDSSYENTIKAFQPFYDEPLTREDAIEIKNNLFGVFELLSKNQRKISNNSVLW